MFIRRRESQIIRGNSPVRQDSDSPVMSLFIIKSSRAETPLWLYINASNWRFKMYVRYNCNSFAWYWLDGLLRSQDQPTGRGFHIWSKVQNQIQIKIISLYQQIYLWAGTFAICFLTESYTTCSGLYSVVTCLVEPSYCRNQAVRLLTCWLLRFQSNASERGRKTQSVSPLQQGIITSHAGLVNLSLCHHQSPVWSDFTYKDLYAKMYTQTKFYHQMSLFYPFQWIKNKFFWTVLVPGLQSTSAGAPPRSSSIHSPIQQKGGPLCASAVGVAWRESRDVRVSRWWGEWTDTPMMPSG